MCNTKRAKNVQKMIGGQPGPGCGRPDPPCKWLACAGRTPYAAGMRWPPPYDREIALELLRAAGPELAELYAAADRTRHEEMGDEVFIRSIIEFSNRCANDCLYCGLRRSNPEVRRYTMTPDAILAALAGVRAQGATTVVLQSGEAPALGDEALGELVRRIKAETGLAVTLSVGNRPRAVYARWRDCGMDRYLLRFETSDPALFAQAHPDCTLADRLQCLRDLRALGVQTGSGFMVGLPGETLATLADNILLCRELDLDMIGIGPFIAHPGTPLGGVANAYADDPEMFFKALAVLRLFNPNAHIPATTAYDAVFPDAGRDLALQRGANIFMPNATPVEHRRDYLLYPGKPCVDEDATRCGLCVQMRIRALGRGLGTGPGHTRKPRP